MFVVPKAGYKIPDPSFGDYLPENGREVEKNSYWVRRLRDGDVIHKNAPKPQASTKKEVKE
ncbi:DUF2635 domain-containing protein [Acinetobacter sp. Ac_5812]|uniref:DUF2635 domain-containing protein n=1 Tax=Acinetobacter sp. Ac_5812 TaxID=1848937 RepID=UPI00148F4DEA|nr:DUF2635 domain-containing protein [Acinetobacter sp. Ac_5812]NNP68960.1 hypothetical protein [Acinetobacter sp. Ac_5812]